MRVLLFTSIFSFLAAISGCGKTGDLYLPDKDKAKTEQPGKAVSTADENGDL